jgi:hypothetical protein
VKNEFKRMTSTGALSPEEVSARIEARAYAIYESRGHEHGRDLEDWLQAESDILLLLLLEDSGSTKATAGLINVKSR